MKRLYTLYESPTFVNYPDLTASLDIQESRFQSARAFNKAIAKQAPDIVLAEFLYGYSNNYAGVNVCNLDVSLYALLRHAPNARIIVVTDKSERIYVPKLTALFEIDAVLTSPVSRQALQASLEHGD
jgi:DNA-binding NarL/FixJ family response regulator